MGHNREKRAGSSEKNCIAYRGIKKRSVKGGHLGKTREIRKKVARDDRWPNKRGKREGGEGGVLDRRPQSDPTTPGGRGCGTPKLRALQVQRMSMGGEKMGERRRRGERASGSCDARTLSQRNEGDLVQQRQKQSGIIPRKETINWGGALRLSKTSWIKARGEESKWQGGRYQSGVEKWKSKSSIKGMQPEESLTGGGEGDIRKKKGGQS